MALVIFHTFWIFLKTRVWYYTNSIWCSNTIFLPSCQIAVLPAEGRHVFEGGWKWQTQGRAHQRGRGELEYGFIMSSTGLSILVELQILQNSSHNTKNIHVVQHKYYYKIIHLSLVISMVEQYLEIKPLCRLNVNIHTVCFSDSLHSNYLSPPLLDVPAASSDPPLPPETGQHCGTGGGEETATDGAGLPQVSFSSLLHINHVIWCWML